MATPSINGTNLPEIFSRGYKFVPQTQRSNGAGGIVNVGQQRAVWTIRNLSQADWDWLTGTLMGGNRSLAVTAAELWDDGFTPRAFTSGTLVYPVPEKKSAGYYRNVTVEIRNLLPLI